MHCSLQPTGLRKLLSHIVAGRPIDAVHDYVGGIDNFKKRPRARSALRPPLSGPRLTFPFGIDRESSGRQLQGKGIEVCVPQIICQRLGDIRRRQAPLERAGKHLDVNLLLPACGRSAKALPEDMRAL
jgi:hypothetical protein